MQALYDKVQNGKALPARTIAKTTMVDKDDYVQAGVNCT